MNELLIALGIIFVTFAAGVGFGMWVWSRWF